MTPFAALSLAPLAVAAVVVGLVAWRTRTLMFRAALDAPAFVQALEARLAQGDRAAARELAGALRPAWAAELSWRALAVPGGDPAMLEFELEDTEAHYAHEAQRGLLAIHALGRLAFPLALAIAIVLLGQGFDPDPQLALARSEAASRALGLGLLALTSGLATTVLCRLSVATLARAASCRLRELRSARGHILAAGA